MRTANWAPALSGASPQGDPGSRPGVPGRHGSVSVGLPPGSLHLDTGPSGAVFDL